MIGILLVLVILFNTIFRIWCLPCLHWYLPTSLYSDNNKSSNSWHSWFLSSEYIIQLTKSLLICSVPWMHKHFLKFAFAWTRVQKSNRRLCFENKKRFISALCPHNKFRVIIISVNAIYLWCVRALFPTSKCEHKKNHSCFTALKQVSQCECNMGCVLTSPIHVSSFNSVNEKKDPFHFVSYNKSLLPLWMNKGVYLLLLLVTLKLTFM